MTMRPGAKKKATDSLFKRIVKWLHLWLGLTSGIIVFIVCLTGCIWVFNEEINDLLQSKKKIVFQEKTAVSPATLLRIAKEQAPKLTPSYAFYRQGHPVELVLRKAGKETPHRGGGGGMMLKIDPYTGKVLQKEQGQRGKFDFFRFILNGHRALWLPYPVGRPIVNYATLVFVVLLITGLIWWYPKKWNKSTRDKSFKIKWGASFKRLNIDLHNVFGFYAMIFLLIIAFTGMVFGLSWFSKGLYWVTTGDKLTEFRRMQSDTLQRSKAQTATVGMNMAWEKVLSENPRSMGFYYNFPDTANAASTINITVYPTPGQFYDNRGYTFDQFTFKQIPRTDAYATEFSKAGTGEKLRKMNYEIHVGSVLGFPGKVLAFLASLVGASLPVTGFLIWWGKRNKKGKKTPVKSALSSSQLPVKPRTRYTPAAKKEVAEKEHVPV